MDFSGVNKPNESQSYMKRDDDPNLQPNLIEMKWIPWLSNFRMSFFQAFSVHFEMFRYSFQKMYVNGIK